MDSTRRSALQKTERAWSSFFARGNAVEKERMAAGEDGSCDGLSLAFSSFLPSLLSFPPGCFPQSPCMTDPLYPVYVCSSHEAKARRPTRPKTRMGRRLLRPQRPPLHPSNLNWQRQTATSPSPLSLPTVNLLPPSPPCPTLVSRGEEGAAGTPVLVLTGRRQEGRRHPTERPSSRTRRRPLPPSWSSRPRCRRIPFRTAERCRPEVEEGSTEGRPPRLVRWAG